MDIAIMWVSLGVLNLGTIFLLRYALKEADVPSMLREKAPQPPPPVPPPPGAPPEPAPTSFSRVAGIVGAIVLATFFWALANAIVFYAFTDTAKIQPLVSNTWTFFLVGSAMFAPYAFNQLMSIFKN